MNCPMQNDGGAEFLVDYAARKLEPDQAMLVDTHLRVCAECAGFVRSQRVVWDALDDWDRIEIAPDFDRRLYSRIQRERESRGGVAGRTAGLAGVAVVLLAVFL